MKIILQTFPFALDAIATDDMLTGANFAVLIDEAHSSQNGQFAGKMKAALKLAAKDKSKKTREPDAGITAEEIILAYFQKEQNGRRTYLSSLTQLRQSRKQRHCLDGIPKRLIRRQDDRFQSLLTFIRCGSRLKKDIFWIRENNLCGRGYSFEVLRVRTLYRKTNLRAMLENGLIDAGPVI